MEEEIVYPIIKANKDGSLDITTKPDFDFKLLTSKNINKDSTLEEKIDNLVEEVEKLNTSIDTLKEEWNESVQKGLNTAVEKYVKNHPWWSSPYYLQDPSSPIDLDDPKIKQMMSNLSLEEVQMQLQLMWQGVQYQEPILYKLKNKDSNENSQII